LWLFLDRSRLGAMVRAGVDDAAMAAGLGANIPALFTGIFGAGVALAALGGVAAGPVLGLYPGMDTEILIPAFIVIVIGGMGSLFGVSAWLGLAAGVAAAAAGAALIGFFCVRTSGIPFLMLTLAFSQLVYSVALKWRDVTGGSDGMAIAEKPAFFGVELSNS